MKHITKFSLNPTSTIKAQRTHISRDDAPAIAISREQVQNLTPEMRQVLEISGCYISYDPIHMVYEVLMVDPKASLSALDNDNSWRLRLYNE